MSEKRDAIRAAKREVVRRRSTTALVLRMTGAFIAWMAVYGLLLSTLQVVIPSAFVDHPDLGSWVVWGFATTATWPWGLNTFMELDRRFWAWTGETPR